MVGIWGLVAGGSKPVEIKDVFVLILGLFTGLAYAAYFRFGTAARPARTSTAQVMFWGSVSASIVLQPVAADHRGTRCCRRTCMPGPSSSASPPEPGARPILDQLGHGPFAGRLLLADVCL